MEIQKFVEDHPDLSFIQVERFIEEDWPIWKEKFKKIRFGDFIFSELHPKQFGEKEALLIFMHLPSTISCLKTHYKLFERELNQPFDPKSVVHDLSLGHLDFWNKVFENQRLEGILLGFGSVHDKKI